MTTHDLICRPQLQHKEHALGTATLPAATIPGAVSDVRAALAQQVNTQRRPSSERQALALLDTARSAHTPVSVRELLRGCRRAPEAG